MRIAIALWLTATFVIHAAEPIRLHPDNGRCFLFRGRPTVLITSGEHYGAVINTEFDFPRYLEELKRHGFNLTRIFSGTYREVPGAFNITGNTLAPVPDKFVCPWAKTTDARFDLTRWDEKYFARLKNFLKAAGERGVVVELVLFCTMYDDALWAASPMNAKNNVNGIGNVDRKDVFAGKEDALMSAQRALVRKLVTELNAFDNLYFEVCNEPYERGGLTREWNDAIIATIVESEKPLPLKHLIAQNFPPSEKPLSAVNPAVSVLNFHAAKADAVRLNYDLNKVIAHDETGGADRSDREYRTEGWEFMISGGGVYDNLDFSFTTDRPDGTAVPLPNATPGGGGPELRRQLAILKRFIEGFDLTQMRPQLSEPGVYILAQPPEAYAVYIKGVKNDLELALPPGTYKAEWLDTKSGAIIRTDSLTQKEGRARLSVPPYAEDIALRVRNQ